MGKDPVPSPLRTPVLSRLSSVILDPRVDRTMDHPHSILFPLVLELFLVISINSMMLLNCQLHDVFCNPAGFQVDFFVYLSLDTCAL